MFAAAAVYCVQPEGLVYKSLGQRPRYLKHITQSLGLLYDEFTTQQSYRLLLMFTYPRGLP